MLTQDPLPTTTVAKKETKIGERTLKTGKLTNYKSQLIIKFKN